MTYLRKTATDTVETERGEKLLVDEFEADEAFRCAAPAKIVRNRRILRNGEALIFLDGNTLKRVQTGEQLTIVSKGCAKLPAFGDSAAPPPIAEGRASPPSD